MAGPFARTSMRGGRLRRSMSEINVVPYIDVMLVLLVIFMITAPLVAPGTIDLPSMSQSSQAPASAIEILIHADQSMSVRVRDPNAAVTDRPVDLKGLVDLVRQRQATESGNPPPVIIFADKTVPYDSVLKVMDALKTNHISRVGLSVKPAN